MKIFDRNPATPPSSMAPWTIILLACAICVAPAAMALEIATPALTSGAESAPYVEELQASGGNPPYSWSIKPQIVSWGLNNHGQTNIPSGLDDVVAIAAGDGHSLALRANGTVVAWGDNSAGQIDVPAGLYSVTAISGGNGHSLALKADGTVVAWGSNEYGQTGVPAGLMDVIAISAGDKHSYALRSDGTVVAWGDNSDGQIDIPAGLSDVVAVEAGDFYGLALKSDGTIAAWGSNISGETDIPAVVSNVVVLSAGYGHNIAMSADGSVTAWGYNDYGQCNMPTSVVNPVIIKAFGYSSVAVESNGNITAWGYNDGGQTNVPPNLAGVIKVEGGYKHCMALKTRYSQLPTGLTLSTEGILSGIPVRAETNSITFIVQDTEGNTAEKTMTLAVAAAQRTVHGLPTTWLEQYGLAVDGSADLLDQDGDGHTTLQEWSAGTVPTNALSVLRIDEISPAPTGSGYLLRWRSQDTRVYTVERSSTLSSPATFNPVVIAIPGQTGSTEYIDATAPEASPAFYRIKTQNP